MSAIAPFQPRPATHEGQLPITAAATQIAQGGLRPLDFPPPRVHVREEHAKAVLRSMQLDPAWASGPLDPPGELSIGVDWVGYQVTGVEDLRFHMGVKLREAGIDLIAGYYRRAAGCDIRVVKGQHQDYKALIQSCRAREGDARIALYVAGDLHANAIIYARQGASEAVYLCDSSLDDPQLHANLVEAANAALQLGITPFLQYESIQRDGVSCYTAAMQAAATCSRVAAGEGEGPFPYRVADLIGELQARRVDPGLLPEEFPEGVIPVRALPETARMAQDVRHLAAHAAQDMQTPIRSSRKRITLQASVAAHRFDPEHGQRFPQLDLLRQKGLHYAETADAGAWADRVGANAAAAWHEALRGQFEAGMKDLIRAERSRQMALGLGQRVQELQVLLDRPAEAMAWAHDTMARLELRIRRMEPPGGESPAAGAAFLAEWKSTAVLLVKLCALCDSLPAAVLVEERQLRASLGGGSARLFGFLDDLQLAVAGDKEGEPAWDEVLRAVCDSPAQSATLVEALEKLWAEREEDWPAAVQKAGAA